MKAAVFSGPDRPLVIEEVPVPQIGPAEILVKVASCGVCHTDLHYLDHGVPTFKAPPLILGHEASGTVAAVGEGVTTFKEGDRVLLPAVMTCGSCFFCRTGRENICTNLQMFGNHVDGSFAEYVKAPAREAFPLPEEIPLIEGAVIADAVSTPYHAVKNRARVRPGEFVLVLGCGGVGINVVQLAVVAGGLVIAADLSEERLTAARRFGAIETIHPPSVEGVWKEVRRITRGVGADVAFEVVGKAETIEEAFGAVRPGGRLCVVGYSPGAVSLNAARLMFREIEVIGSLGCRPGDYPNLIELVRRGKVEILPLVSHRFPLLEIESAFATLRRGDGLRVVVVP